MFLLCSNLMHSPCMLSIVSNENVDINIRQIQLICEIWFHSVYNNWQWYHLLSLIQWRFSFVNDPILTICGFRTGHHLVIRSGHNLKVYIDLLIINAQFFQNTDFYTFTHSFWSFISWGDAVLATTISQLLNHMI